MRIVYARLTIYGWAALALVSAAHVAVAAKTATATARTAVLIPLSITKVNDLNFGNIVSGATAGTVTINQTTGAVTRTGGATVFGTTHNAASFTVAGSAGQTYAITLSAPPILTRAGGTQTIALTALRLRGAATRKMVAAGTTTLSVGGTLAVPANQMPGAYSGVFTLSVAYQ